MLNFYRMLMILTGCVIVAFPLCASADATADARKAIQAAYNRQSTAINKKDAKGAEVDQSPDYVSVNMNDPRPMPPRAAPK